MAGTGKQKRPRKYNGSSSSLASIQSREDNTVINDGDVSGMRHATQDSMVDMKQTKEEDIADDS